MPNEDTDRRRLKRARALLEMFEEDCGRQAASVEELRDWMGTQYTDQLQIRMNRRLHGIDAGTVRSRRKGLALAG
jgi:CHAD domain-containing protein